MADKSAGSLSNAFNGAAMWDFTKAALWIGVGFFVGGVIDYTFFHNHPLGHAIIKIFNDSLMGVFDFAAKAIGLPEYARNPDYLSPSGEDCIPELDPITGMLASCG